MKQQSGGATTSDPWRWRGQPQSSGWKNRFRSFADWTRGAFDPRSGKNKREVTAKTHEETTGEKKSKRKCVCGCLRFACFSQWGVLQCFNRRWVCVCLLLIVDDVWRRSRCFPLGVKEASWGSGEGGSSKGAAVDSGALSMFVWVCRRERGSAPFSLLLSPSSNQRQQQHWCSTTQIIHRLYLLKKKAFF